MALILSFILPKELTQNGSDLVLDPARVVAFVQVDVFDRIHGILEYFAVESDDRVSAWQLMDFGCPVEVLASSSVGDSAQNGLLFPEGDFGQAK